MGTSVGLLLFLVASETAFSLCNGKNVSALAGACNLLGLYIHRNLAPQDDCNIVTGPFSIQTVLGMLLDGSRGNTAEQIRTQLRFKEEGLSDNEAYATFKDVIGTVSKSSRDENHKLSNHNVFFFQKGYPFRPEYKEGLRQIFNSNQVALNFRTEPGKAARMISERVKKDTNNQIEKFLLDVHRPTVAVLSNVMHYEEKFTTRCKPEERETFYNWGSQPKQMKMMWCEGNFLSIPLADGNLFVVGDEGKISVMTYVPNDPKGAYQAEKVIAPSDAIAALKQAKKNRTCLLFPQFELRYEPPMKSVLSNLGMKAPFAKKPNLRGISMLPIVVSDVRHENIFKLDETGIKMSVVTTVQLTNGFRGGENKMVQKAPRACKEKGSEASGVSRTETEARMDGECQQIRGNHPYVFAMFIPGLNDIFITLSRVGMV